MSHAFSLICRVTNEGVYIEGVKKEDTRGELNLRIHVCDAM